MDESQGGHMAMPEVEPQQVVPPDYELHPDKYVWNGNEYVLKLLPCPNPDCRNELLRFLEGQIYCPTCKTRGPEVDYSGEKWNALPRFPLWEYHAAHDEQTVISRVFKRAGKSPEIKAGIDISGFSGDDAQEIAENLVKIARQEMFRIKRHFYRVPDVVRFEYQGAKFVARFFRKGSETVCILSNGKRIDVGHSACNPIDNLDPVIGDRLAFRRALVRAFNLIWHPDGYPIDSEALIYFAPPGKDPELLKVREIYSCFRLWQGNQQGKWDFIQSWKWDWE